MTPPFDTGRVRLRLTCVDGKVSEVHLVSDRPEVVKILKGRSAAQALKMLPLLFALCGKAQTRVAELAIAAARGKQLTPEIDHSAQKEALREHLWRSLLDLPPLLGATPLHQEFVTASKLVTDENRGQLYALLASPAIESLRFALQQQKNVSPNSPHLLPLLDAQASLNEWSRLDAAFCRQPEWRGAAAETGAIARKQVTHAELSFFAIHWLARFDELIEWAKGENIIGGIGTVSAVTVAPNIGRSLVETARGLLMHEVVLDGEQIIDYLIVAPTEWNFNPQGALVDQLIGHDAQDRDALQQHIAQLVATLDPCVPWELEWA
ncbi:MAG: nickel-dependent hydrogenase large subunit [Gallionellaceae bacterium]